MKMKGLVSLCLSMTFNGSSRPEQGMYVAFKEDDQWQEPIHLGEPNPSILSGRAIARTRHQMKNTFSFPEGIATLPEAAGKG